MKARFDLRLQLVGMLVLLALAAIVGKLWWVQVVKGASYASKLRGNSEVTVRMPSTRGEIRDRNGIPLVTNRASYEVDFYLPEMVKGYRERGGKLPLNTYRTTVDGMVEDRIEPDIVQIVNEAVIPRLEQLKLANDYNAKRLRTHFRNDTEVPFSYIEDLPFETLAKFAEHDVGLPGVDLTIKPARHYVYGALAAHILGYVGAEENVDRASARSFTFYQGDVEGKAQVEQFMDRYLRGEPGVRVMQRNAKGVIDKVVRVEPPKQGGNVQLTIDARIQLIAERALRNVGRGAAVVVDPRNGDILAMASVPSFDPNTFIPSISQADWKAINDDPTDPLTNRAISSYAPGSTYKIPIALAGLAKGIGRRSFSCAGGVTYGDHYFKCWIAEKGGSHGSLGLSDAIKVSCNAFFYQYGNAAGIEKILEVGTALGLGMKTDVSLSGESPGILPGPEWLAANSPRERWSQGQTANVSIGQGYVLASPLQMAMVAATVANGGICYYPRIVDKVVDRKGGLIYKPEPAVRADLSTLGLTADQIEIVRKGMWKVVNEDGGTARRARLKDVEAAGKTGTAQFWRENKKDNHTWFISFAPYVNPTFAICVFVQGAKAGGLVSAPIAAKIYEETFALERQDEQAAPFELAVLEPAKGSFDFISEINFGRAIPAAVGGDDENSDNVQSERNGAASQESRATRGPNIKPEADEQGRIARRAKPVAKEKNKEPDKPKGNFLQRLFQRKKTSEEPPAKRPSKA